MTTNLVLLRSVPERRRLWLRGKLTEKRAKKLISSIRSLSRSKKPILLRVYSPGGSHTWALKVIEAIEESPAPVWALVTRAYSAAFLIVQACNLRIGKKKSKYNIHFVRRRLDFLRAMPGMDTDALKQFIDEKIEPLLREAWRPAHELLQRRIASSSKTEEDLLELLRQDTKFLNAKEAMEWNFLDDIQNVTFPRS